MVLGLEPKDAIPWIDPRGWRFPAFGSATATENPGPFIANPYALPLPTDTRHALTEGDLLLLRLTDLDLLACERIAGNVHSSVEVYKQGGSHQLRATFDGKPLGLSQRFIEQILFDFWAVADIRSMLMAMLEAAQQLGNDPAEDSTAAAAPEIPTLNSFAYRDSDGTATPILVSRLSDFTNLGVSIPYEDLEAIAADTDQSDIRAMIERQGHQLVMRLDNTEPPGSADRRP